MQFEYFTLPMSLEKVMRKEELGKCSLEQSVIQHLHLLVTTGFGEFAADESFGCGIWDYDFDSVSSAHKIKEVIRLSLLQSIQKQEKRLGNIRVELNIVQEELSEMEGLKSIKKRMDILVSGVLQVTNERLQFKDTFYVGPLSY